MFVCFKRKDHNFKSLETEALSQPRPVYSAGTKDQREEVKVWRHLKREKELEQGLLNSQAAPRPLLMGYGGYLTW